MHLDTLEIDGFHSDLDRLHDFRLCHLTGTCSAQTLRGLSTMDHLDLRGLSAFLDNIQL